MSKPASTPTAPTTTQHDDDLIVVPKGQSRAQFFFILFLLIFLTLVFTVGGYFQAVAGNMFGGGGQQAVVLRWTNPETRTTHEVVATDFADTRRALAMLQNFGMFRAPGKPAPVDNRGAEVDPEDTAAFLIYEKLATEAGYLATEEEARTRLAAVFQTGDILASWARSYRQTPKQIEDALRRVIAVEKYQATLRTALAVAAPERVLEMWGEQHTEYAFQYVGLEAEQFVEEAKAELPPDEELTEWFHALPEFRQRKYYTEDTLDVEVAYLPLPAPEGFDGSALLNDYPLPEEWDAETEARNYYNEVTHIRFRGEGAKPSEDDGPEDDGPEEDGSADDGSGGTDGDGESGDGGSTGEEASGGEEADDTEPAAEDGSAEEGADDESEDADEEEPEEVEEVWYHPFEDVQAVAEAEAPLRAALRAWSRDFQSRTEAAEEGQAPDLATEARTRRRFDP